MFQEAVQVGARDDVDRRRYLKVPKSETASWGSVSTRINAEYGPEDSTLVIPSFASFPGAVGGIRPQISSVRMKHSPVVENL
jgi:hypothetical protein